MPTSVLVACIAVSVALAVVVWVVAGSLQPARGRAIANLQRGLVVADEESAAQPGSRMRSLGRRFTPPILVRMLERQHARAGRPADWPIDRLLDLKLLSVPVAGVLLVLLVTTKQQPLLVMMTLVVAVVAYFVPDLLLLSRGQERAQLIQLQLADTRLVDDSRQLSRRGLL